MGKHCRLTALYRLMSMYRSVFGTWPNRQVYGFIPRMKMHAKLSRMPTNRPMSMDTMTTVKNVPSHTIASKRDIFQNSTHCFTCISIPLRAITIILAKIHCNIDFNKTKLIEIFVWLFVCLILAHPNMLVNTNDKNGIYGHRSEALVTHLNIAEQVCDWTSCASSWR